MGGTSATGGIPTVPEIPGRHHRNVVDGGDLHRKLKKYQRLFGPMTIRWLTRFWMPIGKRVVIIGATLEGCELAEFFVKRGRKVTIVDTGTMEELGIGMGPLNKLCLFGWLAEKGAAMMAEVGFEKITDQGLIITTKEGEKQTIAADTIVITSPLTPDTKLADSLEGKVTEIYPIGDSRDPGLIVDAIADGAKIGHAL